ncbi:PAS domain S-box protein [Pedobacter psychrodurus]|uniref:PAS domain S-box protein n=1 Tax=Pedobacter psychrodurus TaxID=2530456 RepID=UPI002930EE38|nr:PAS domain S-box protein [Pedobacter psychrodurus]
MYASKSPSPDTLRALETAPAMFLVLSPNFDILTASDLFLEATASVREDIVGKYIFDAFPDNPGLPEADGVANIRYSLQYVVQHGTSHKMPAQRYDVPDISIPGGFALRYWEPQHSPVFDQEGKLSYIIQSVNNVTEQTLNRMEADASRNENKANLIQVDLLNKDLAEAHRDLLYLNLSLENDVAKRTEQLALSEIKYRNLIEYSPVAMQVFRGEHMTFELVNEAMLRFLGKTADIIGKTLFEGVPEIVGQPIVEALYGVYRTGEPLEIYAEKVVLERDGQQETGYYDVIYRALHDEGKISGVLGIAIEVTAQVLAQQSIVESEARFRTMAENSDILISLTDEKGRLEYLNAAWAALTGWPRENLKTFGWSEFVHPGDREMVAKNFLEAVEQQREFTNEFRLLSGEGNYRWLRVRGTPRVDGDQSFNGYICSGIDITDEKQRLLEIEHINKALIFSNEELLKTNLKLLESEENLLTAFDAGDLGSCSLNLKTGQADMSERYRRHYGLPLDQEISWEMVLEAVEPEFLGEVNLVLENAVKFGSPVDSTYAIRHLLTGERRWMRVVGKVYEDADGINERIYAIVMDVTDQKEDEQRKNDFIAMVSHELKTPLTSITGYIQLLQLKVKAIDVFGGQVFLDKIQAQLRKMTNMINGFLNISRLESGKIQLCRSRFDISTLIGQLKEEYSTLVSTHPIRYIHEAEIWVNADEDKISHVVNNLLSNAVKYSSLNSDILIKCDVIGEQAILSVHDRGLGIAEEDIPKLFDRYYRVQNERTNTIAGFGIGLYLCAEIVERHGGKIWVESKIGVGSVFSFSLPYAPRLAS